jgi:hypothetical protein
VKGGVLPLDLPIVVDEKYPSPAVETPPNPTLNAEGVLKPECPAPVLLILLGL